jgi:hypothetical protein
MQPLQAAEGFVTRMRCIGIHGGAFHCSARPCRRRARQRHRANDMRGYRRPVNPIPSADPAGRPRRPIPSPDPVTGSRRRIPPPDPVTGSRRRIPPPDPVAGSHRPIRPGRTALAARRLTRRLILHLAEVPLISDTSPCCLSQVRISFRFRRRTRFPIPSPRSDPSCAFAWRNDVIWSS